ncbi:MAG TPA: hypothetical protein VHW44_15795 [Pseudonocardiaceae bacterium]|nr:hypothetical protein [Pseudonocardiaceae bacterium]
MAVRIDADTLSALVGEELVALGREHLDQGRVEGVRAEDGGATAVLVDPGQGRLEVWAGVLNGEFSAECDGVGEAEGELCGHAVAVALAGLRDGVAFSSVPTRERYVDQDVRDFATIARGLTRGKLIDLVSRRAADDRYLGALLRTAAGEQAEVGEEQIAAGRQLVADMIEMIDDGHSWDPRGLVKLGTNLLTELEVMAAHPVSEQLVVLIEDTIEEWARVPSYMADWENLDEDVEEIGNALADLHLRACAAADLDPLELAARLAELVADAESDTYLDAPDGYADILGPEGIAEYKNLIAR